MSIDSFDFFLYESLVIDTNVCEIKKLTHTHKPTKKLNYRQYKRADCTHFGTLAFEWA